VGVRDGVRKPQVEERAQFVDALFARCVKWAFARGCESHRSRSGPAVPRLAAHISKRSYTGDGGSGVVRTS
jgi:hypothetical protein